MITLKEKHFKNSKRETNNYVQEDSHIGRSNSVGQKDWHNVFRVQKGKKKKTLSTKNTLQGKAIIQN